MTAVRTDSRSIRSRARRRAYTAPGKRCVRAFALVRVTLRSYVPFAGRRRRPWYVPARSSVATATAKRRRDRVTNKKRTLGDNMYTRVRARSIGRSVRYTLVQRYPRTWATVIARIRALSRLPYARAYACTLRSVLKNYVNDGRVFRSIARTHTLKLRLCSHIGRGVYENACIEIAKNFVTRKRAPVRYT